jgi:hypothetical protein
MKRHSIAIAIFLAVVTLPGVASAKETPLDPKRCEELAKEGKGGPGRLDVVVFNHGKGQLVWPAPAKLKVPDEGIFVVVFTDTDSTKFDYSIKALDTDESKTIDLRANSQGVAVTNNHIVCVSWQHHEEFPSYRVNITRRVEAKSEVKSDSTPKEKLDHAVNEAANALPQEDAQKLRSKAGALEAEVETEGVEDEKQTATEMEVIAENATDPAKAQLQDAVHEFIATPQEALRFPYTFPVWVETSGVQLSFSTGLGFSDLANHRFFIKTDDQNTKDTNDDTQTVGRDRNGEDAFRPDMMAFATLHSPTLKSWNRYLGFTVGLGIGDDSSPRYFTGFSLVLSRRMVLSVGATGAQVKRLPAGQELGKAPINGANTLNQLDSGFKLGGGLSFSLRVGKEREKFLGVLNPPQKIPETPKEKAETPKEKTGTENPE